MFRGALCGALCGAPFRCIGQAGLFDEIDANAVGEPNPIGDPHMAANLLRGHHGRFRYANDFSQFADLDVDARPTASHAATGRAQKFPAREGTQSDRY